MIKIEHTHAIGWEATIRGMRNPLESWDKSDSDWELTNPLDFEDGLPAEYEFQIGDNDHDLMMQLRKAGSDHRKFMRMITVYADITAPLYWWKEYDTYKVGTVANSCSTMHKIADKEFTPDDFSWDQLLNTGCDLFEIECYKGLIRTTIQPQGLLMDYIIPSLNVCRKRYNEISQRLKVDKTLTNAEKKHLNAQRKMFWWQLIQLLPSSYNQKRTVMLNYEVLANQYKNRKNHKLDEWRDYCRWIESLPCSELITGEE